jgi:hypothetical protein
MPVTKEGPAKDADQTPRNFGHGIFAPGLMLSGDFSFVPMP